MQDDKKAYAYSARNVFNALAKGIAEGKDLVSVARQFPPYKPHAWKRVKGMAKYLKTKLKRKKNHGILKWYTQLCNAWRDIQVVSMAYNTESVPATLSEIAETARLTGKMRDAVPCAFLSEDPKTVEHMAQCISVCCGWTPEHGEVKQAFNYGYASDALMPHESQLSDLEVSLKVHSPIMLQVDDILGDLSNALDPTNVKVDQQCGGHEDTPVQFNGPLEDTPVRFDGLLEDTPVRFDGPLEDTTVRFDGPLEDTTVRFDGPLEDTTVRFDGPFEEDAPSFRFDDKRMTQNERVSLVNLVHRTDLNGMACEASHYSESRCRWAVKTGSGEKLWVRTENIAVPGFEEILQ